jgi:hypothetical protein
MALFKQKAGKHKYVEKFSWLFIPRYYDVKIFCDKKVLQTISEEEVLN